MAREPREQFVLQLLEGNWNSSNTFGLTPSLLYASSDEPSTPHITVPQPDEGPIGGGATGYDGIDPSGGNPHQTIAGTITLHAFAQDGNLGSATTSSAAVYLTGSAANDGTVSGGVVEEVYRIVRNNAVEPSNPTTGNTPVLTLASGQAAPGPTEDDTRYHQVIPVSYVYTTG